MKKLKSKFVRVLLATSALAAPGTAWAQDDSAPMIDEILVRGENIPDVMRTTSEISSVINTEDFIRQGDDTAASALVRLTGLSLVNKRFVYVRGLLGERYSSALLNGSPLPSPEPLQRVVPLDLFPSSVLSGAVVQKTYSPQFPGEFGGGVIGLETLAVPSEGFFSISGSWGGNSETSMDPGLTYYGGDWDWTGYDDGTRDMPSELQKAIASGKGRISEATFTDDELQVIGRDFVNAPLNVLQRNDNIPVNWGIETSFGNNYETNWGSLGIIAAAGFDNSWETRRGITEEAEITTTGDVFAATSYDFESTQNDAVLNGLFGVGLDIGDHRIQWTNFYVHSTTKEARSREGFDHLAGIDVRDDFTEWFERELMFTQLLGDLSFGDLNITLRGAVAETTRDTPYEKGIRYRIVNGDYLHSASQEQNYTRFGAVEDTLVSGGVDLKYFVPFGDSREVVLLAGYAYSDNERSASQREFRFLANNAALPIAVQKSRVDYLLSDVNIRPDALVIRETTGADGAAAYDANLKVDAFYAQIDAEVIPYVRTAIGARFEDATEEVTLVDLFGGPPPASPAPLENDYVLPAATITWNFYEDMQLRLGASKTIARPQFRELAPQPYLDPDNDRQYIGNPYLVDTELTNYDIRAEWYFGTNQFVAASLFYKDIDKPVELIINEQGASQQTTFINAPKATLTGGEVEIRKNFELPFGNEWMKTVTWFTSANYTYTKSEVQVEAGDTVFTFTGGGLPAPASVYVKDGSPLQGQSENLANLQFGFEDLDRGLQATLLASYGDERISTRGRPGFPDLVSDPGILLDFTTRLTLAENPFGGEMSLGFEARNLLGEEFEEVQTLGTGTVYTQQYELGTSFSFSLSLKY